MVERKWSLRRTLGDLLLSACAMAIIMATLVAFDGRVRDEVSYRLHGGPPSADVVVAKARARSFVALVASVARDKSQHHASLMMFLGAATMLTVVMVRT